MEEVKLSSCVHSGTCGHHHHPETHTNHKWARVRSEEVIFSIAYMIGMSLWQLPMEDIDGNPVPTVIFHQKPTTFHAFVLGLALSFSSAFCTIQVRERNPKAARYYRLFSVAAFALTLAILLWAAVPAGSCGRVASFVL